MNIKFINSIFLVGFLVLATSSCSDQLDVLPTNDITSETVYSTPLGYKQSLAKVYGAFALTGNSGGAGNPDIPAQIIADEGNSDFLRLYWNLQELTTDEASWTWQNDGGIKGLKELSWSSVNPIINGVYYRSFFQITLCNDFIRQSSDEKLISRGIGGKDAEEIRKYRAEARFLRAFQYWVLIDLFGNPPFVTEKDAIGSGLPKQIQRKDLFTYIESELKEIEGILVDPGKNEYPRAEKSSAWALLARLYLNAEVYTGTPKYTEAITYVNKIKGSIYSLHPDYRELTLADNQLNKTENLFMIAYDAKYTQNWGGTTYLTRGPAAVPGSISGTGGNWGGLRTTQQFVGLFSDDSGNTDRRAQFYKTGQNREMTELYVGTDGYSTTKYRNKTRTGAKAPNADPAGNWTDIDFPLFRLGEMNLIYAEAVLRGGKGGDMATALTYINQLRTRAYGGLTTGNISASQLTLDFILDERGRELYHEAHRRTDLIRFKKFTSSTYLWAWKGGVAAGRGVDELYNVYPIPSNDLSSNPNLVQNKGY